MNYKDEQQEKQIMLNLDLMDCFENEEDLAVITGGKGILQTIKDIIDSIEVNGNNCKDCNGNCGC